MPALRPFFTPGFRSPRRWAGLPKDRLSVLSTTVHLRARGTPGAARAPLPGGRFTPARAGHAACPRRAATLAGAYPRACGALLPRRRIVVLHAGLSPRVRGGPSSCRWRSPTASVHPRIRGAAARRPRSGRCCSGSLAPPASVRRSRPCRRTGYRLPPADPRARGATGIKGRPDLLTFGSIPARAGQPSGWGCWPGLSGPPPRARGNPSRKPIWGPPPRARGNPEVRHRVHPRARGGFDHGGRVRSDRGATLPHLPISQPGPPPRARGNRRVVLTGTLCGGR